MGWSSPRGGESGPRWTGVPSGFPFKRGLRALWTGGVFSAAHRVLGVSMQGSLPTNRGSAGGPAQGPAEAGPDLTSAAPEPRKSTSRACPAQGQLGARPQDQPGFLSPRPEVLQKGSQFGESHAMLLLL